MGPMVKVQGNEDITPDPWFQVQSFTPGFRFYEGYKILIQALVSGYIYFSGLGLHISGYYSGLWL